MALIMPFILAGVRSRVTWLNGKTHLCINASSCIQAGVLCTYITPSSEAKTVTQSRREQIWPYSCFSCECVSMTRETLCMWKIWFPLSSPELSFWDMCVVGWSWLDANTHQSLSVTSLHSWTGERKCNRGFLDWDKDWERSVIKYHGWNRFEWGY